MHSLTNNTTCHVGSGSANVASAMVKRRGKRRLARDQNPSMRGINKKSNQVCHHFVREAAAMGECLVSHVRTHLNLADLATKIIPGGIKRSKLVDMLLYDIESESHLES